MTELQISPTLALPLQAVTETFGILAVKRAGKSNAAVVIAEAMFAAGLHWVAIDPKGDWWGIRSSGDGKGPGLPIVVFGGLHADVPLDPAAGQLVADIIVEQRLTCVIDVSEMTKADMRRFLTALVKRLYQRNREPLHLFCEEADEYIPQMVRGDAAEMVGAFETLVKRGGFRGLGCTLITQRSASLNNDVLTQIQTLIALRTTGVPDRKRIEEWVTYYQAGKELVQQLPLLADGEALMFSPNFLRTVEKIRFNRRHTFDSGSTPKVGVKARPPVTLADVDLVGLRDRMAATIEKAKAEDPKELRKRIAELERQLRAEQTKKPVVETVEKVVRVEVPVYPDKVREWFVETAAATERAAEQLTVAARMMREAAKLPGRDDVKWPERTAEELVESSRAAGRKAQLAVGAGASVGAGSLSAGSPVPAPGGKPSSSSAAKAPSVPRPIGNTNSQNHSNSVETSELRIGGSQQRILDALAWFEGVGLSPTSRNQVAFMVGLRPTSGGFKNYLGALRTAGAIDYPSGGYVALTDAGRAAANPPDIPPTTEALQAQVMGMLGGSQRRILQQLIDAYPTPVDRDTLAAGAGLAVTSGGFKNYLGQMRTLGLVAYPAGGQVAAEPVLFLGESRG